VPKYSYDHIHLRSKNPMGMAQYFRKMFDAKIIESVQSDGQPRIDLDINGLAVFIARVAPEVNMPPSPRDPHLGLDHFGFRVDNLDEAVADLKRRGAEFAVEPYNIRPGVRIAFVRAPDDVRIELLERR
jgi:catechol 2,3-dioxygenase-like lactoylglutathione lyase family enzyme